MYPLQINKEIETVAISSTVNTHQWTVFELMFMVKNNLFYHVDLNFLVVFDIDPYFFVVCQSILHIPLAQNS